MKTSFQKLALSVAWFATLSPQLSTLLAQGSLTPPGAPAPTFKTLAQIEPRTPISALPYTIATAGSYYLVSNLTGVASAHGITIASGNVALDLKGFTLQGAPLSFDAIRVSGTYTNIAVHDGTLAGWGGAGFNDFSLGYSRNTVLERLMVSGCGANGIYTEAGTTIRDCSAVGNDGIGIHCFGGLVAGCVSRNNDIGFYVLSVQMRNCQTEYNNSFGVDAVGSQIVDCLSQNNGGAGFALSKCSLRSSRSAENAVEGINAAQSLVTDCSVFNNGTNAIVAGASCQIVNNLVDCNNVNAGTVAIYLTGNGTRIDGNHVVNGETGIRTTDAGYAGNPYPYNLIVRNTLHGQAFALPFNPVAAVGLGKAETITNPGQNFASSNAWANIIK